MLNLKFISVIINIFQLRIFIAFNLHKHDDVGNSFSFISVKFIKSVSYPFFLCDIDRCFVPTC